MLFVSWVVCRPSISLLCFWNKIVLFLQVMIMPVENTRLPALIICNKHYIILFGLNLSVYSTLIIYSTLICLCWTTVCCSCLCWILPARNVFCLIWIMCVCEREREKGEVHARACVCMRECAFSCLFDPVLSIDDLRSVLRRVFIQSHLFVWIHFFLFCGLFICFKKRKRFLCFSGNDLEYGMRATVRMSHPMDDCVVLVSVNCQGLGNRQKWKDVYLRNKKDSTGR